MAPPMALMSRVTRPRPPQQMGSVAAAPASVSAKELIGYHEASRLAGDCLAGKVRRTVAQCPGLGRHILDVGFGTALARTRLSYRELALVTIATMTAVGDFDDQLKVYVTGALTHGATIVEVQDIFTIFRNPYSYEKKLGTY